MRPATNGVRMCFSFSTSRRSRRLPRTRAIVEANRAADGNTAFSPAGDDERLRRPAIAARDRAGAGLLKPAGAARPGRGRRASRVEFSSATAQVGVILSESLRPTNDGLGAVRVIPGRASMSNVWCRDCRRLGEPDPARWHSPPAPGMRWPTGAVGTLAPFLTRAGVSRKTPSSRAAAAWKADTRPTVPWPEGAFRNLPVTGQIPPIGCSP